MFAMFFALVSSWEAQPVKFRKFEPAGFTCTASNGAMRRVNIDLQSGQYDEGDGRKKIDQITDTKIVLRGPNPDLIGGASGMGPIISSLELNRTSLILLDQVLIPERNINRQAIYQCRIGSAIAFGSGRQF